MHHLDEGTIHSWLDGALSAEESRAVEAHAAACAECAALVVEARGLVAGASRILLGLDDVPAGVIPVGRAAPDPLGDARHRRWWSGGPVLRAAAAVLVIASAGALIARSSVPDFLGDALRLPAAEVAEPTAADASVPAQRPAAAAEPVADPGPLEILESVEASVRREPATTGTPGLAPPPPAAPGAGVGATGTGARATTDPDEAGKVSYIDRPIVELPAAPAPRPLPDAGVRFEAGRAAERDSIATVRGQQGNIIVPPAGALVEMRARTEADAAGAQRLQHHAPAEPERSAQIIVEGRVTNAETGIGIEGVQAFVRAAGRSALTDSSGVFRLSLPDTLLGNSVIVSARRIGYGSRDEEITILGGTARVDFTLSAAAMALEQLVVTGVGERRARAAETVPGRGAAAAPAAAPRRGLSAAELQGCWEVLLGNWRPSGVPGAGSLPSHLWLTSTLLEMTADGPVNEVGRGPDSPPVAGSHWRIDAADSVHLIWRDSRPDIALRLVHRAGGLLRSAELRGTAAHGERTAEVILRRVDAARCR